MGQGFRPARFSGAPPFSTMTGMDEARENIPARNWRTQLDDELRELSTANLRRRLRVLDGTQGPIARFGEGTLINLSSNNYLGLAGHPAIIEASAAALRASRANTVW